jgi:hypothetical protein
MKITRRGRHRGVFILTSTMIVIDLSASQVHPTVIIFYVAVVH